MIVHEVEQGTEAWYRVRMGMPTSSEFATVMRTKGRGENGESKERKSYLLKLAGERITGEPMYNYTNADMERGKRMEDEARQFYAFTRGADPVRVGFVTNHDAGCSPDSFIDAAGMLEIKTAYPHILADKLLAGDFPSEHKAQCQGGLWVTEREWADLIIYWPKMPPFVMRATRDEIYIKQISDAVARFNDELAATVEQIRKAGEVRTAA